ncbi:MAG: alpha/beta hydrolase [Rickettsiaceae bacterium]|nr:alpha/beta hydrolase [Rickettsiaceae bacterium]
MTNMNSLYTENNKNFIIYHKLNSSEKKAPSIIFHHGLMSSMNGSKALYLEKYCQKRNYNFIRFDNFGHGQSSGRFVDQNISTWLEGLNLVIKELTNGPVLLIGSSMGGWITMLKAIESPEIVRGIICISAAPDFTEELIWDKITTEQKTKLLNGQSIDIKGDDPNCSHSYPISNQLIVDGRRHLLLNKERINITCPVHLIHGMQDTGVPYEIAERIMSRMDNTKTVLKLIKDGSHALSREEDMQVICDSIEELLVS